MSRSSDGAGGPEINLTAGSIAHLRRVIEWPAFDDGRYDVVGELGRGGSAHVYLARDNRLGRDVAIKVATASVLDRDAARALAEAQLVGRLEHPAIVPVYDAGQLTDGRTYCVMRRVRGLSLEEFCQSANEVELGGRLRIIEQVCDAVAFAHDAGVIHCDLTPRNIMIGDFGEVFVMDWGGAARLTASGEGERGVEMVGTQGFGAPEQGDPAARLTPRSDVFAIGRLLAYSIGLVDGVAPSVLLRGRRLSARALRPLAAIVSRAAAAALDERYASVSELAADIRRYLYGEPVTAYVESWSERGARVVSRHRVILTLVASYLAMRVALLIWR